MDAEQVSAIVSANLARVREKIAAAAQRAGRDPGEIRLVAVTKYVDSVAARALYGAGCHDLAESRPQELWTKAEALAGDELRWHLVGHLQRNKVRRTLPYIWLIQSIDSVRLLHAVNEEAERENRIVPVLLEINISGDQEKHGFNPDEAEEGLAAAAELSQVDVIGFMGMAAREGGGAVARKNFAALRGLRDRLSTAERPLAELSMGMSGDFCEAIAEGATMVRIGSALFEGLKE